MKPPRHQLGLNLAFLTTCKLVDTPATVKSQLAHAWVRLHCICCSAHDSLEPCWHVSGTQIPVGIVHHHVLLSAHDCKSVGDLCGSAHGNCCCTFTPSADAWVPSDGSSWESPGVPGRRLEASPFLSSSVHAGSRKHVNTPLPPHPPFPPATHVLVRFSLLLFQHLGAQPSSCMALEWTDPSRLGQLLHSKSRPIPASHVGLTLRCELPASCNDKCEQHCWSERRSSSPHP